MDGYASTDGELDSDTEDSQELGRWLKQLDQPLEYNSQTRKSFTSHSLHTAGQQKENGLQSMGPAAVSQPVSGNAELVDFDSILGDLNALDELFDLPLSQTSTTPATRTSTGPVATSASKSSVSSRVQSNPVSDFDSCDAVLRNALLELNAIVTPAPAPPPPPNTADVMVSSPPPVPRGAVNGHELNRRPSSTSTSTSGSSEVSGKDECSSPEAITRCGSSARLSTRTSQIYIQIHSPDGTSNKVMVDETTTAGRLCELVMKKRNVPLLTKWVIVEHLPGLFMERRLECHELIVDVVGNWNKDGVNNKLLFVECKARYSVYSVDDDQESCEFRGALESSLYLKSEGKKVWKKVELIVQSSGLYHRPAGKGKYELTCLEKITDVCVYISLGWRKKYKAPSEYGIALKPASVQSKSPKLIRYICADDETTFSTWLVALRQAKYGSTFRSREMSRTPMKMLDQRSDSTAHLVPSPVVHAAFDRVLPPNCDDSPAPFNGFSSATINRRKGSLVPALPISTQTTRLLSQQSRLGITDDPSSFRMEDCNQTSRPVVDRNFNHAAAEFSSLPAAAASPSMIYESSKNTLNSTASLPVNTFASKPAAMMAANNNGPSSLCSQQLSPSVSSEKKKIGPPPPVKKLGNGTPPTMITPTTFDASDETTSKLADGNRRSSLTRPGPPPPPPTNLSSPQHGSPARSKPPPPPPKRSENTRLTSTPSFSNVNSPFQTKTFIMNLDRVIELKKCKGNSGLASLPVPLPPRPAYVDGPTYLDTDDLPPPPAELLEGLKQMRIHTTQLFSRSPSVRR